MADSQDKPTPPPDQGPPAPAPQPPLPRPGSVPPGDSVPPGPAPGTGATGGESVVATDSQRPVTISPAGPVTTGSDAAAAARDATAAARDATAAARDAIANGVAAGETAAALGSLPSTSPHNVPTSARQSVGVGRRPSAGARGDVAGNGVSAVARPRGRDRLGSRKHLPHTVHTMRYAPPWLVSAVFHMLLILVLGLWVITDQSGDRLLLIANLSDRLGDQLDADSVDVPQGNPDEKTDVALLPNELPEVEDPFAAPPPLDISPNPLRSTSTIDAPAIGLALTGREEGMKKALLAAYGGTGATEKAVLEGLKWLVRQQRRDGSWSLTGPYTQGGFDENIVAATAMAMLAFQGAGHTHQESSGSPFHKVVRRGLNVLLKNEDRQGNFFHRGPSFHRLYTQAQCTIALCELYGMTHDKKLKEPAQRAVAYCLRIQDAQVGGWRYSPGTGSDTSVTGWFVMALQSARMAYLAVPDANLKLVSQYLDSVAVYGGSRYLYRPNAHGGPAMTAEGLLCRQYLGWSHDDPRLLQGVEIFAENPIDWNGSHRNVYYWYYATQVCHHMGGAIWNRWNRVMRNVLPAKQTHTGRERGSWSANGDRWGAQGGRLYVTCLSIYMLEVYYRHLAIYQQDAIGR